MGQNDYQLMVANETTYNTPVTVTRTFEYDSEGIEETYGRTEGDPLRRGSAYKRNDRHTPYFAGAAGPIVLPVMSKGFGFWLPHMLGGLATTGPTDSVYTHTGTEGALYGTGKSFTAQINRPLDGVGTDQPFTYAGGKVTEWTLSNAVDGNLMLDLACDFASVATGTALASASYPSSMENLTWAGGVVTIAGDAFEVDEVSFSGSPGYNVDRRKIRGSTDKREPKPGRREGSFSLKADFDAMTQRNRAAAAVRATNLATIVGTWTAPTLAGVSAYPQLIVTMQARFDTWKAATESYDAIEQELSGIAVYDGTNSPIKIEVKNTDSTA